MKRVGVAMVALFVMSGCATLVNQVPAAGIYSNVTYPSYYQGVTNDGPGSKEGKATASSVFGLFAGGDASVEAAARNSGITKIKTVSHTQEIVLGGLWNAFTTTVTGE